MKDEPSRHEQGSPFTALTRIFEWALPDQVTREDVWIGTDDSPVPPAAPAAIVRLSADRHYWETPAYEAGLSWSRTYRAFPSIEAPRIIYPVDVPFKEFSAILRPRVMSLRKRIVTSTIAALPQIIDIRAQRIVMATKTDSRLSKLIDTFAPPEQVATFVGYRDHLPRPSLWMFDKSGSLQMIAKYASGPDAQSSLANEYRNLVDLKQLPHIAANAPQPIEYQTAQLGSLLVATALHGQAHPRNLGAHARTWLESCVVGPDVPVLDSPVLQALVNQLDTHPDCHGRWCHLALDDLAAKQVPKTIVHGDFAPWNMLIDGDHLRVFDWEIAELNGIPEWDRLYFELRVGLLTYNWNQDLLHKAVQKVRASGSSYYNTREWKAVIWLALCNLSIIENDMVVQNVVNDVLSALRKSWWSY